MVRRAGIVLGVVLTVVLAALSVVVIGIRTKYPPVLNRVRRYARDVGNPRSSSPQGLPARTHRSCGTQVGSRASSTRRRSPRGGPPTGSSSASPTDRTPTGSRTYSRAAWRRVTHNGSSYRCDEPAVIPTSEAADDFSAPSAGSCA